ALVENVKKMCSKFKSDARITLLTEFGEAVADKNLSVLAMPVHSLSVANFLNGSSDKYSYRTNDQNMIRFSAPDANVLIVDDINTNLIVAEGLIRPYKVQVMTCKSGADAIEAVKSHRFDLVFMDHMMPEMDGIEATSRIRNLDDGEPYYKNVPIIALTANAVFGTKEMFLKSGFNDFLSKPIDTIKLNTVLEKWIPEDKQKEPVEDEDDATAAPDELKPGKDIEITGIDVEKGVAMTGGTMEGYLRTLSVFHDDGIEKVKEIKECLEANNISLYTTYVHALKSASASIGAGELSEIAKSLEFAGKNRDMAYIDSNNDKFLDEFEILLGDIKEAISRVPEPESASSGESLSSESAKEKLSALKDALNDMDVVTADEIMNELSSGGGKSFDAAVKESLSQIAQNILLCDYDDAVSNIDALINKL
ncbi:MAG: response regulator, partial [Synergistaceae bacterium]|nr:response regulator [Synergistaceae bacterium]